MKTEREITAQAQRASVLLSPETDEDRDAATYYDKEYLRGVEDALDWAIELTDNPPIRRV